jgi:hypothetical protein
VGQHSIWRAILRVGRDPEGEHRAHGGGQAARTKYPRERVATLRLVPVCDCEQREVEVLGELYERGENATDVLITVRVDIAVQRRRERVDDEQACSGLAGEVPDAIDVAGQAPEIAGPVALARTR